MGGPNVTTLSYFASDLFITLHTHLTRRSVASSNLKMYKRKEGREIKRRKEAKQYQ